jgi:putative flippase GtrA
VAFALIGIGNAVLYFVIFNLLMTMGAVKATILATAITTTLAYVAHRYWTYRARPKATVRREYMLFVGFNVAGMFIQSSVVAFGKYGLGMSETRDRLWFNLATVAGIGLATVFRFWAYRTLVFRPHPADHAPPTTAAEALAEAYEEDAEFEQLTAPLKVEMRQVKQRRREEEPAARRS